MTFLCPFCGADIPAKNSCSRESCREASARIPLAVKDSRGLPGIKRTWQSEEKRLRKAHQVRMLPAAFERMRAAASREKLTLADWLERLALTLPPE